MVKMIPASEADYRKFHDEDTLLIQYLLTQSPNQTISVSRADMDAAILSVDPKSYVQVELTNDTMTYKIHVPEVEFPYPHTSWVNVPEPKTLAEYLVNLEGLVPHG